MKKAPNIYEELQATYNIMDSIYMVQNKIIKDKAEQIPSKVQKNKYQYLVNIQYYDLTPGIGILRGFILGGEKLRKSLKYFNCYLYHKKILTLQKQSQISFRKLLENR